MTRRTLDWYGDIACEPKTFNRVAEILKTVDIPGRSTIYRVIWLSVTRSATDFDTWDKAADFIEITTRMTQ